MLELKPLSYKSAPSYTVQELPYLGCAYTLNDTTKKRVKLVSK